MNRHERQKQIAMRIAKRLNHYVTESSDGYIHKYNDDEFFPEPERFRNYKNYIKYYKDLL